MRQWLRSQLAPNKPKASIARVNGTVRRSAASPRNIRWTRGTRLSK
jgi:hypothetical protein